MKKMLIPILIISMSSCVTNPYKESDLLEGRTVGAPAWSYIIPGLPQAYNDEWIEAAGYFAGFITPAMMSEIYTMPDPDNPGYIIIENETMYNVFIGAASAVLIGSIVDGIITTRALKKSRTEFRVAAEKELAKEREKEEEARKSALIWLYGTEEGTAIYENKIWIGMSREQLLESWGRPWDINRTVYSWGVHEQFCYPGSRFVYVEDGEVTSWQD